MARFVLCPPALYTIVTEAVVKTYLIIAGKLGFSWAVVNVFGTALWVLFLQFLYFTLKWQMITWILFWAMIIVYFAQIFHYLNGLYKKIPNTDDVPRNRKKDVPRNGEKNTTPNPEKSESNPAPSPDKTLPLPESFYF